MPTTAALARSLSSLLEKSADAPSLPELLHLVDEFVEESKSWTDVDTQITQLEEELVALHQAAIDYSSVDQLEIFLACLFHLERILTPTSVISWFDLILRPALREPKLSTAALNYAKELIISTLQKPDEVVVGGFRRRLLELYLLDAFNEGSGGDALEWAELTEDEREHRRRWKSNLQDILIAYGGDAPDEFLTEVNQQFQTPSRRLQLLILLNEFTSSSKFCSTVPVLASHKIMTSLANCLFLDNSSTVCTAAVRLTVKFIPYFAVHARSNLKATFPQFLAILARIMCWKERVPATKNPLAQHDEEFERELYRESSRILYPRRELKWERLEMTFSASPSTPPNCRQFFTILYYLYPSNVLKFIRGPATYLKEVELESPYTVDWNKAFEESEVKRRSENFVREHICHPFLIWGTAAKEMTKPEFWNKYDVGRIVSEATMLDIRYLCIGLKERFKLEGKVPAVAGTVVSGSTPAEDPEDVEDAEEPAQFIQSTDLSNRKVIISLQDMIEASVALKTNIDVDIVQPTSAPKSGFISNETEASASAQEPTSSGGDSEGTSHVIQTINGLQREVLLLRNELNFELWHSRENSKHIGRLYEDRILMRTAESERQGLYNKLRRYRAQVVNLETELRDHKQQAASAKNGYADWTRELQEKMKELREDKKRLMADLSNAQAAAKDLKALYEAQGKRLAESLNENFNLKAETQENVQEIATLKDYERQIEELTKMRQVWEDDSRKFTERGEELDRLQKANEALQARISELERVQNNEADARDDDYRRQIQSLELRLAQMEAISEEDANQRLADENAEMKSEIETLQAVVASLKDQLGRPEFLDT
ncbi:hypothetical protein H1R20_g11886, partial [Candolleomyces eurysporus]